MLTKMWKCVKTEQLFRINVFHRYWSSNSVVRPHSKFYFRTELYSWAELSSWFEFCSQSERCFCCHPSQLHSFSTRLWPMSRTINNPVIFRNKSIRKHPIQYVSLPFGLTSIICLRSSTSFLYLTIWLLMISTTVPWAFSRWAYWRKTFD